MKEKVLCVKDLCFGYNTGEPLFDHFNLDVHISEVVCVLGESGKGKSTLFELISGNLTAQSGVIQVDSFSWVFQDPYSSFHPSYSIINQIQDVADTTKLEGKAAMMNLDRELLFELPHKLSGGQLQRCGILRALLMEPKLLLCDEPTSALDNVTALEVMQMLVGFLDDVGILLITHDEDLARWCGDKICKL